jgi:hypothetical protein
MDGYGMVGVGWIAVIFLWLIGLAALFGIIYAAVRLATVHALKAHTRWLDGGRPGGGSPAYPAAQQPYPGYPSAQPRQPVPPGAQPGYPGVQPGYPTPPSTPGQPYPGYPGGQQANEAPQPTQPTAPLPQSEPEEPPGRPKA